MPEVTPPAGSEPETPAVTTPVNPAQEQRLSTENGKLRIANKELTDFRKQIEELGSLDDIKAALEAAKASSPTGPGGKKDPEVARLQREYDAMKADLANIKKGEETRAEKGRQKILTAELTKIAAEGGLNAAATAVKILAQTAKVADDDVVVFTVPDGTGGTREVPATLANLKEHAAHLLGDGAEVFLPAAGVGGTGSRGPQAVAGGLDLQKILKDPALYEKHRDEIFQKTYGRPAPK